jgi:hypothetical protein
MTEERGTHGGTRETADPLHEERSTARQEESK